MQPFSLFIGLGTLAGLVLVSWRAPEKQILHYLDAGLGILLCALIGSRVMAVGINFSYYQAHLGQVLQVWSGGLSGIGAFLGSILGIFIFARWLKVTAGALADAFLPLAGILMITAWMGCWMDSCSYGWNSDAWWALPGRDVWGVLTRRVPVQLMGALATLILLGLAERVGRKLTPAGITAALCLFGFSAELFALSFLRIDPTPTWQGLRLEAWGAIGLMVFSILAVVVLLVRRKISPHGSHRMGVQDGR